MIRLAAVFLLLALPLRAEVFPALYAVTGVAADDVLNIREAPAEDAPILDTLAPDATGIEVMEIFDGWATVNAGDQTGYVAARFLLREPGPDWTALQTPLTCLGTEPFWSLTLDPGAGTASLRTPDAAEAEAWQIDQSWPGLPWSPAAALSLSGGMAVLTPADCSDGMSNRSYGIGIDVFQTGPAGGRLAGCCLLDQP